MVLWLTILSYFLFFSIFNKYIRSEMLSKSFSTLIHLYSILSFVSSITHARWSKQLNTLALGRVAKASPSPGILLRFQVIL